MQLDCKVEGTRVCSFDESRPQLRLRRLLRKSGCAGKGEQIIDVMTKAPYELCSVWKSDQRDVCVRSACPQCTQCRHSAKQIAELQRSEHGDACRRRIECVDRHDAQRNSTRKRAAPRSRQYTASGGRMTDVTTISSTCVHARELPASRSRQNCTVNTVQTSVAAPINQLTCTSAAMSAMSAEPTMT